MEATAPTVFKVWPLAWQNRISFFPSVPSGVLLDSCYMQFKYKQREYLRV